MRGQWNLIRAFWLHDFREAQSYPLTHFNRLAGLGIFFFLLHGLSEMQGGDVESTGIGVLPFIACGYAVLDLMWTALGAFTSKLRRHQTTGMLEACLMTGHSLPALMGAMPVFDLSVSIFRATGVVVLASLFMVPPAPSTGWLFAGLFGFFGVVMFLCFGLISAALLLRYKAGDPLNKALHFSAILTGGVLLPRRLLPEALANVGGWVPIAPVVDGVRLSLQGQSATELAPVAGRLALLLLVSGLVALWAVRRAVLAVLREGSLSHY